MTERRFTDKEVAIVLRRAADLEKKGSSKAMSSARGLTVSDLREIAAEAGIDPDLVTRAATELDKGGGIPAGFHFAGPGTAQREVRAISAELSREEMAALIFAVDEEVSDQGTVQEALGQVRWTSQGRFLSTQVSLEPSGGETLIRVEERYNDAIKGFLHGAPTAYSAMIGLLVSLETLSLGPGLGIPLGLAAAAAGWGFGTGIWRSLSSRSKKRAQKLAEKLGLKAGKMAEDSARKDEGLAGP